MGLGKTAVTLTALRDLMFDELKVSKVLVIAPLRVARDTWPAEVEKWDHLQDIEISVIVGSVKERTAAVNHNAFIYVVNRENVKWLVEYYEKNGLRWDFDMIVIDELWQPDENALAVAELAKYLADELYTFALTIRDEDTRNRYIKRVQKLQQRKHRKTMVEDAKSVYPIRMSAFDSNEYLFNLENGTLDLRTLEFHEHDPKDFITKISHINYDPAATCPRWNQFIDEVMVGRKNVARYLQKAIGYALSGDTSLECLFIMFGPTTRNGKTTAAWKGSDQTPEPCL